ncbi:MAG: ankyrin repeat domain-containing protein, partial [Planctomycetes bacterium]|nr:ankyrin repeat domain-containing protein [Planctomycetota bacterium]
GATLLHHTAAKGDAQAAMLLLDTGAPMSSKDGWGYTPLHWAADAGAVETAKLLLSRGVAPDAGAMNGQTPLHRAAWGGSADMVKLLLSAGADVSVTDYRDFTPLHYARSAQAAQALLDGDAIINARPNNYSMTPLAAAAQRGDFKVVKFLLHQGADQTLADDMACTPLHWAAWAGDADSVKLLLTKSELTPDKSGRTVLDYAACRGHQQVVDLLSAHN